MTCSRGDIVVVWFPHSNQQDFSRRPAIVVQADNLATLHHRVIAGHDRRGRSVAAHAGTLIHAQGIPETSHQGSQILPPAISARGGSFVTSILTAAFHLCSSALIRGLLFDGG